MTTVCLPVESDSLPSKTAGASPLESNPRNLSSKLHALCAKASRLALALCVAVAVLCTPLAAASGEAESVHRVNLFPSASDARERQGFVRVINHSARAGEVSIRAFDEGGVARAPLTLALGADETVHFNSGDLERGNPRKGLSGRTGAGEGNWRLELSSGLDIEVLSYIRTADGFLTAIHDAAPVEGSRHRVAIFNPGSNRNQISLLRLVNPGGAAAEVSIAGVDDAGASPGAGARATVPARGSRTYTAAELESRGAEGLSGSIGDGSGKWRLVVESERPVVAMSLLSSPTGHLTNLSTAPDGGGDGSHAVPLFPAASDPNRRQGFVRVVNRSGRAGAVAVAAFDDTGRGYGPLTLTLGADETVHFNSGDLERGNPGKGLSGRTGAGEGHWRLELSSGLDIEVLSYIRTADGFLTAMHDTAPRLEERHRVATFNPGSNDRQVSLLRLVNPGNEPAEVSIVGVDDDGESPGAGATATVPAGGSRTYTAAELESGGAAGLSGSIGDGSGKWRLTVRADRPILAMSLLSSPTGHLSNLSTAPGRGAGPPDVVPPGDSAPPPPLGPDPANLARRAEGFRSAEFARNPSLYYMNAHWAYARGVDGSGETTGMVDTGLYAAHQEFAGGLHEETVYSVLGDDSVNYGYPQFFKVGERDPPTAYPALDPDPFCRGVQCKYLDYEHGTLMASLAVGGRNGAGAHGMAFGADLLFRPFRQLAPGGTKIGAIWYHPPGDIIDPDLVSFHQVVRQVGDVATIVSNSWLTGDWTFRRINPTFAGTWPFHEVLTPRYVRYQRDRPATGQALLLWSAGNRPYPAGPFVDGAVVPSVSERQLRAWSGGETGLADLLLTGEERADISAAEALQRAEQALEALKRRWLAVVAVADAEDTAERRNEHVGCASSGETDASAADGCAVDWTMAASARCGFASDWCLAAGPSSGGVGTDPSRPPQPTGLYRLDAFRTSEATATASGALAVLLQAYRDGDGRLTVPTSTVLKRLATTARRDLFDPATRHGPDSRNVLLREEDMIRALIRYAGASDDDLRKLIDTARAELNGSPPADDGATDRLLILNRLVPYRATIGTGEIRAMLNAAAGDSSRAGDLLVHLIRQIEWIDEQLRRRGRSKATATDDDVREIAITSLIGHGLIDLKAATDPR